MCARVEGLRCRWQLRLRYIVRSVCRTCSDFHWGTMTSSCALRRKQQARSKMARCDGLLQTITAHLTLRKPETSSGLRLKWGTARASRAPGLHGCRAPLTPQQWCTGRRLCKGRAPYHLFIARGTGAQVADESRKVRWLITVSMLSRSMWGDPVHHTEATRMGTH